MGLSRIALQPARTGGSTTRLELRGKGRMSQAWAESAESATMTIDSTIRIPVRMQLLAATGLLLERLDQMPRQASAAQYQGLVRQLERLLQEADGEPSLQPLLDGLPGLAEVHENRHYAVAGLCRSPLSAAVAAEQAARDLIERVRIRH